MNSSRTTLPNGWDNRHLSKYACFIKTIEGIIPLISQKYISPRQEGIPMTINQQIEQSDERFLRDVGIAKPPFKKTKSRLIWQFNARKVRKKRDSSQLLASKTTTHLDLPQTLSYLCQVGNVFNQWILRQQDLSPNAQSGSRFANGTAKRIIRSDLDSVPLMSLNNRLAPKQQQHH